MIPYDLELGGDFFGFADFFHGVDELVSTAATALPRAASPSTGGW